MKLALHLSNSHECGYFNDRLASTLFLDPSEVVSPHTYHSLLNHGFRRSGQLIYKPHCKNCNACVPLRINSHKFKHSRSQKRVLSKNADLDFKILKPEYKEEHYQLYKYYLNFRHENGGMEKHTKLDYHESMVASTVNTCLIEFRLNQKLVCVAVTDTLSDGLSAVYTFFDPSLSKQRSLGTFAVLTQIKLAKSIEKSWLYLGYWIKESPKMAYKANFSGSQILTNGEWNAI